MISNGGRSPRRHALPRYLGILGGTVITAAAVALAGGMPVLAAAGTAPVAASGGWTRPHELEGPRGIGATGRFTALSCASRLDCTAVGYYVPRSGIEDFAVTERRGVWGRALSMAAPAAAGNVSFGGAPVLSCASAGNCAAGDGYGPYVSGRQKAFVVSETNGTWGKARQVPSVPAAMSCPAPGDCTAALAGGYLVSEVHGAWRKAFPVPGLAALSHGQAIDSDVISCPSPGSCAAAGSYTDSAFASRSFVVTQRHGIWGSAQPVRSDSGTGLAISLLSCASAGNCVAAGFGFIVTEAHGRWGTAGSLPGTFSVIGQLDCPAAGACSAAGLLHDQSQGVQAFVSTEKNGTWHQAQAITGGGFYTSLDSLSCDAAGNCVLAGYIIARDGQQAASAALVNGRWGAARIFRGVRAAASMIEAVSCPARSRCTAVGHFFRNRRPAQLFAVVQR